MRRLMVGWTFVVAAALAAPSLAGSSTAMAKGKSAKADESPTAGASSAGMSKEEQDKLKEHNKLRAEITDLRDQATHLTEAHDRGDTTVGELTSDLARIRAWAGLTPGSGQGSAITVRGQVGGDGVEDLINELRNAGAEAISVDGVRIVTGIVVAGAPGALSVENNAIGDAFEVRAIGSPQILTGTLTRTGGVIAQIGATYPDAQLTVTPVDMLTLPATDRTLVPAHGQPRL